MDSNIWITPSQMISVTKNRIKIPIISAACFLVMACIYLWTATPLYESSITLTARSPETNPLSQIGGLAGSFLLGGLGHGSGLSDYDKLFDVLMSQDAASALLSNNELMHQLFPNSWDAQTISWKRPSGVSAQIRTQIDSIFGLPSWSQPGAEPILNLLEERFRIVHNDSGMSNTISMFSENPKLAKETLLLLLTSADNILRDRARHANADNVNFLRNQLASESTIEVKTDLSRQLGQELSKSSVLASSAPYSYEILKDLRVSSRPVSPRPLLSLFLALVAGVIVGFAIIIVQTIDWQPSRSDASMDSAHNTDQLP